MLIKPALNNFLFNRSGVAAVEFALIAPILFFVLIGIIDTAFYVHDKMKVEAAARASVDYVVKKNGDDETLMVDVLSGYFDNNIDNTWQDALDYETNLFCECASDGVEMDCDDTCDAGDYKRRYFDVEVSKTHNTFMAYPGFPSTIVLQGQARIRLD